MSSLSPLALVLSAREMACLSLPSKLLERVETGLHHFGSQAAFLRGHLHFFVYLQKLIFARVLPERHNQ